VRRREFLESVGPYLGLAFVALIFGFLVGPQFFRGSNLELIARQTAIVCTAALGMTMVIVAGGIDLSVGSVVALTTVVIALGGLTTTPRCQRRPASARELFAASSADF
jgi:ribose transport system permease protein